MRITIISLFCTLDIKQFGLGILLGVSWLLKAATASPSHHQPFSRAHSGKPAQRSLLLSTCLFGRTSCALFYTLFIYLTPSFSRFSANTRPGALPLSLQNGSAMRRGEPPQAGPAQRSATAPPGGGQGRGRGAGAGAGRAPSSLDASTMRSDIF